MRKFEIACVANSVPFDKTMEVFATTMQENHSYGFHVKHHLLTRMPVKMHFSNILDPWDLRIV